MASITFSGIGSSIDTAAIVDAIVAAEIEPQRELLSARKTTYNSQLSAIGKLKSALEQFQSVLDNLKMASKFQARSVSVGNSDLLSASATGSAVPGSYQIEIDHLAKQQKLITAAGSFATSGDTVGTGKLNFTVGTESFEVPIDSSSSSLSGIRDAINSATGNSSVSATIVNVDDGLGGTEARLMLTSIAGGLDNKINITAVDDDGNSTDASGLSQLIYDSTSATGNMTQHQAADDALFYIDGLAVSRSSNSVSDAIDGVTLDLKSSAPGTKFSLDVAVDNDTIANNIQSLVDAYNNVRSIVKSTSENEGSSALMGDSTVRTLYNKVRSVLSSQVASAPGSANSLSLVGVSIDQYGVMSLDREALGNALNDDFSAVSKLFTNDDGIAPTLDTLLESYTQYAGLLDDRTKGLNSRLESLTSAQERLDRREESMLASLTKQYNAMDSLVAQLNSTGSYLLAQLSALSSS
ncbi:B-type flagellar hook-associated protein 2 [Marinobacterium zhoushanense]|uniref:Flagellar hook-associated protein 2 n=1 Tax=Marinobacterium zhoushanense TaxID=1679163 RepID=A0ABQ1KQM2_9GAMM|nr:flagellar filament capping protein FliD [Marinobacterium zhoushanense]GGC07687.1 B-type flagellar hook-associated protein 2 [Marinobacterium zhoushanense]